jgi:hypothetical protein
VQGRAGPATGPGFAHYAMPCRVPTPPSDRALHTRGRAGCGYPRIWGVYRFGEGDGTLPPCLQANGRRRAASVVPSRLRFRPSGFSTNPPPSSPLEGRGKAASAGLVTPASDACLGWAGWASWLSPLRESQQDARGNTGANPLPGGGAQKGFLPNTLTKLAGINRMGQHLPART